MAELSIDQALQKGIEAHKAGRIQEADRLYTAILKAQPKHADANHNMGVLAVGVGKVEQALPFFKTALEANPATAQFWLSYIDTLIKLYKLADAKAVLDQAKSKGAKGDGFDKLEQQLNEAGQEPPETSKVAAEVPPQQPNILDSLKLDQAIKLATKKVQGGWPEEARRIYQDILSKFPKNKRARDGLKGLAGKAIGKASNVQDPPPDQLQSLINLYSQGQFTQALDQISTLVQQFPKSAVLFNTQGAVFKGLKQFDHSIEAYNKAIAIKPDYVDAYYNMGVTFNEQGKLDEAIKAYNRAIAIKPDNTNAYNNMGNALKDQGKAEEAIAAYKKALAIKPEYAEAYNNIGTTLQDQGELDEAIKAFNKALEIKPDYGEAYYNMGNTLNDQGTLEKAIEAYDKALAMEPNYAEAHNNKGNALKNQGKMREAIEAYNKALSINPNYAEAHSNMGNALKDEGKLEQAIEAYNKALAINPNSAEVHSNIGVTLTEEGKLEEAIAACNRALSINPNYAEAHSNMGDALKDQGKLKEAIEAYNKALAIKPDYAAVHLSLSTLTNYSLNDRQISVIENLLKRPNLNDLDRCHLHYAHAKIKEDLGNISASFDNYLAGGELRKKLLAYNFSQDQHQFSQLKNTAPQLKDVALNLSGNADGHTPIFILGMPRSGTTLVEQIISSHTEIIGAGELNYIAQFGSNLAFGLAPAKEKYLKMFRECYLAELVKRGDRRTFITDKMPHNFRFIALICAVFPEAKIIHVRRNAKATCWSNFKQYFASKGLGYSYNLQDTVRYYGLYIDLMHFWYQIYNDRIYSLDYDKLTEEQEPETRRLIEHLGLNWEDACLAPHNNNRSIKTASQQQVRQKVYKGSSQAWRKYEPFLDGVFDELITK